MTERKGITALELLGFANDKGEIGYAYGGHGEDWPAVEMAKRLDWITYGYDASQSSLIYGTGAQQREVYFLTDTGRAALRLAAEDKRGAALCSFLEQATGYSLAPWQRAVVVNLATADPDKLRAAAEKVGVRRRA